MPDGRDDLRELQDSLRTEFDAALAVHDAHVRRETLREVASSIEARYVGTKGRGPAFSIARDIRAMGGDVELPAYEPTNP